MTATTESSANDLRPRFMGVTLLIPRQFGPSTGASVKISGGLLKQNQKSMGSQHSAKFDRRRPDCHCALPTKRDKCMLGPAVCRYCRGTINLFGVPRGKFAAHTKFGDSGISASTS